MKQTRDRKQLRRRRSITLVRSSIACSLLLLSTYVLGTIPLAAADSSSSTQDSSMPGMDMGGMNMSGMDMGGMDKTTATSGSPSNLSYGQFGSRQDKISAAGTNSGGELQMPDGLHLLPYRMQNGYKVFHLTAEPVWWDSGSGQKVEAWAYNGTVPGPEIRVNTGDKVKIILHNKLPKGTTIHWQGLSVPFVQDGVGGISQPDIAPGKTFTYTFTVTAHPGAYFYRAAPSIGLLAQNKLGLWGPFIVEPKGTAWRQIHPGYQKEYTVVINDSGQLGYSLNGKSFPATTVPQAHLGDKVLIHLINTGSMEHPMHLHGLHFQQIEQDGDPLPKPVTMDTISVAPGATYDIQITADQVGKWLFHCHIVDHVVNAQGQMTGLVTFLNVTK